MLFSLLVSAALAKDPQLWSVAPNAPADALTVRASASATASAVGTLPAGAKGIVEVEQNGEGWLKISAGTLQGWVSGDGLVPQAPPSGSLPSVLTCSGAEPFWSVELKAGQARVVSPDRPSAPELPFDQVKTTSGSAFLVTPRGKGPGYRWLTVSLAPERCSDGMSERRHAWEALALTSEHGFVAGCCRVPN